MATEIQEAPLERPSLFLQLRAAIRVDHAVLNKAIFGRFPDCVPPKADNAYLYVAGMSVFGQIYAAIEESWDEVLNRVDENDPDLARYKDMLFRLQTPLLARKEKWVKDLEYIEKHILPAEAAPLLSQTRNDGAIFKKRITDSITSNPPLLMAYAWVMYLALFNGGRWMAEELVSGGSQFWHKEGDAETYSEDMLSFWFFDDHSPKDTRQHGETVKVDFCQHFDHAAEIVNEKEQDEVVAESHKLFHMCVEMVEFMDQQELQTHLRVLAAAGQADHRTSGFMRRLASWSRPVSGIWTKIAGMVS